MTLADICEVLNISSAQAYDLVRSGELSAIQIGVGRQCRVEARVLDEYISRGEERTPE